MSSVARSWLGSVEQPFDGSFLSASLHAQVLNASQVMKGCVPDQMSLLLLMNTPFPLAAVMTKACHSRSERATNGRGGKAPKNPVVTSMAKAVNGALGMRLGSHRVTCQSSCGTPVIWTESSGDAPLVGAWRSKVV